MDTIHIGPWTVAYDREATRRAYAAIPSGSPEECGCAGCRNLAAARPLAYPPEFLSLLDTLGINPRREAEVVEYGPDLHHPGHRVMDGWYHLVGRVLAGPPDVDTRTRPDTFDVTVTRRNGLVRDAFGDQPVVQLEWSAPVPWVLDEPPPEDVPAP